jgi:hypothetical protein
MEEGCCLQCPFDFGHILGADGREQLEQLRVVILHEASTLIVSFFFTTRQRLRVGLSMVVDDLKGTASDVGRLPESFRE